MNSEAKINRIKQKIMDLDSFLPGSISEQWNVCGNPNCKCKDSKSPKKHGPYYQLSYTLKGKGSSLFIKKHDLGEAHKKVALYQKFKDLCNELTLANIEHTRSNGFSGEGK